MTQGLTRRRFLSLSAAAIALPSTAVAKGPVVRWRGYALGAAASMTLSGVSETGAAQIFAAVEAELSRLEDIFSLYRQGSALARLNRAGALQQPPAELLEVIALSDSLHRASAGVFDPTIQPLWRLYAARAAAGTLPSRRELAETRQRTGWRKLAFNTSEITFENPGMALTFNGVAQGYIADKVADLLRARGLTQVLIDMGEISALGRRPDGRPWQAGIATPNGEVLRRLPLEDRALATSAPLGTVLDPRGRVGHILDPRSGTPAKAWKLVSVSADRAALADGLSTAFSLLPRATIAKALRRYPDASLEILV